MSGQYNDNKDTENDIWVGKYEERKSYWPSERVLLSQKETRARELKVNWSMPAYILIL